MAAHKEDLMTLNKKTIFIFSGLCLLLLTPSAILWNKVNHVAQNEKFLAKGHNAEILALKTITNSLHQMMLELGKRTVILPDKLTRVTCAQQLGIVKQIRTISLNTEFPAYNPSIIENEEGGYHLFYRYDKPKEPWKPVPFYTYIGYADLDTNFNATRIINKVNTGSHFSEDPRIVKVGKDLFLSWNDKIRSKIECRTIHSGKWNPKEGKLEYVTNLDQHIRLVEKNWVPFERWENNKPRLSFVYAVLPHKIMDIPFPKKNEVIHLVSPGDAALSKLPWMQEWGHISGGTTARLIEGEYISFFHSFFQDDHGMRWYVMGAYTFEKDAPHKITSITPYPIVFPGIYDSQLTNTADASKRVIYPAGIAVEKKEKNYLLHVSCGENDCAIKIITIDYNRLKKNMKPLQPKMFEKHDKHQN
jgi:predicted GH43/DUF377 family glycosyl hydrolase